jgi:hypothetical protein
VALHLDLEEAHQAFQFGFDAWESDQPFQLALRFSKSRVPFWQWLRRLGHDELPCGRRLPAPGGGVHRLGTGKPAGLQTPAVPLAPILPAIGGVCNRLSRSAARLQSLACGVIAAARGATGTRPPAAGTAPMPAAARQVTGRPALGREPWNEPQIVETWVQREAKNAGFRVPT